MTARHDTDHNELFKGFASAIQEHLAVDEAKVRAIAADEVSKAALPRPVELRCNDRVLGTTTGQVHRQFDELTAMVEEGHRNMLMVGPAGSGKTTLAKNVAEALGLEFGFISLSAGVTETHLFGRMLPKDDGTWGYVESVFVRIYRNGGVFLLDEVDAADANVMVSINAALANGSLCNPVTGEVVERHADCYILAAANTWGRGASTEYVGRNALDAATLDRFVMATVSVTYDTDLEANLIGTIVPSVESAAEIVAWIGGLRSRIEAARLRRIASTRLALRAARAIAAGRSLRQVEARYYLDWSSDERRKAGV